MLDKWLAFRVMKIKEDFAVIDTGHNSGDGGTWVKMDRGVFIKNPFEKRKSRG